MNLESTNQQIGSGTTMHEGTLMWSNPYGVPSWLLVRTGKDLCAFPWSPVPLLSTPRRPSGKRFISTSSTKKTGNRIQYRKVDSDTGREVGREDIIRGYEKSKGQYIPVEPEERSRASAPSRSTSLSTAKKLTNCILPIPITSCPTAKPASRLSR